MSYLFRKLIICFIILSVDFVVAQTTMIFTEENRSYRDGEELFDKLKYSAAQSKFEKIVNNIENPQDELRINAEFYYALCALELFHLDAELLLKRFVLDHPDHPKAEKVFFQLGRHNYRLKKFNKVIELFSQVDQFDLTEEEKIEYHFKFGYAYFTRKKNKEAKSHFNIVLSQESDFKTPATYYFSHIAYTEDNLQTALNGFESISSSLMFKSIVPYYITQIYHKQKKYDLLIEYAPVFLDSISSKRKGEFSKLIGDAYYFNEQYETAIPYFKLFKKSNKASREDNYQLGYSYYRTGDYEKGVQYLMRVATKKDGLSQTAYYHMADAYLKMEEKDYARNAFHAASEYDFEPEIKQNSLFNYAKLAYELSYNPYDEAIEAFHEYIEAYPNSEETEEAYEFLIKVYLTTKNYDDALNSLDRIKNKDNRMKIAYQTIVFNRAVELFHNESYNLSRDHFSSVKKYPIDKKLNSLSIYWMAESSYKLEQYGKAIEQYNSYRNEPGAVLTDKYRQIEYNIGYSNFKMGKPFNGATLTQISESDRTLYLNNSIKAFRSYVQQAEFINKSNLQDAYLRIADCYFLLKDDQLAIEYYDEAINIGESNLSYAYFQKAKAQGLIQDYEGKVNTLNELTQLYPNSKYQVMSLLSLAQTYNDLGDNQKSIDTYIEFIDKYPNNNFVSNAIVEVGGIYLKEKNYSEAEKYFLQILSQYPDAEIETSLAIELMKEVYIGRNDLPGYYLWLEGKGIEVSQNERDSTLWAPVQAARDMGDCLLQIEKAEEYLNNIENPIHEISAHYYIANCLYANGKDLEALDHYNIIINKPNNNYYTEVLRYAGNISYGNEDFNQALGHYSTLENVSISDDDANLSIIGQMRCFWHLNNYQSTIDYCDKAMMILNVEESILIESYLYKGISLKELQKYEDAIISLRNASEMTKSIKGAKAKFFICEVLYIQGLHEECENEIMELVQQKPSYDYWIARAIILLGDNFVAVGDYFNAKHSLQSIIDNYDGQDKVELVKMAQDKIDAILVLENSEEENFEKEDVEIDFNEVDPKDQKLFEEDIDQNSQNENDSNNNNNNNDED